MRSDVAVTLQWMGAIALALVVLAVAAQVLLLVFAGMLLAILLRSAATGAADWLGVDPGWTLAATLIVGFGVVGLAGWALAPDIAAQTRELISELPRAWQNLQERLEGTIGERAISQLSEQVDAADGGSMSGFFTGAFGAVSSTLGAVASGFVIFFICLYLAADPAPYRHGFLRLVPPASRARAADLLDQLYDTLLWWLLGKLLSMVLIGVLTYLGLLALGVPLALSLALLAGLLTFIPNFGPVLAAAPAVLLALSESPSLAGWVVGLYTAIQIVESYGVTPLIQQRTVSLPPGLTLAMQVLIGVLTGVAGMALATPMTAAGLVLVRELYVRDRLERDGEDRAGSSAARCRGSPDQTARPPCA